MPANWSSDDLDYRAQLIPWTYWHCDNEQHGQLPREFVAAGQTGRRRCPICGSRDVTEQPSK